MSKIARQTLKPFASAAGSNDIGVFGSLAHGPITYSQVIATIQSLASWLNGFADETVGTNVPALEDVNAVLYVFGYMLCYLLQDGMPEYDASTTYYIGCFVKVGSIQYVSLVDTNLNNAPASSPNQWAQYPLPSTTIVIEPRTSDPTTPAVGRCWLRTDL